MMSDKTFPLFPACVARFLVLVFVLAMMRISAAPLAAQELSFLPQKAGGSAASFANLQYSLDINSKDFDAAALHRASWTELSLPALIPYRDNQVWLRVSFTLSASQLQYLPLYLLSERIDTAADFFIDGVLFAKRGTDVPSHFHRSNEPGWYLLPQQLLGSEKTHTIYIRLYAPRSAINLFSLELADELKASKVWGNGLFLGMQIYALLSILCAFIALYFFALWVIQRQDRTNLWYAVSSLAIAFYFSEMGSSFTILPMALNRALGKFSLMVCMSGLVAFFIAYCKMKKRLWLNLILIAVPLVALISFLSVMNDIHKSAEVFNLFLLYVQFGIIFSLVSVIIAVKKGNREAIPVLLGVLAGIGFGMHDVVYSFMGRIPQLWLQGPGFFFLNISMFISLTMRSGRQHRDLQQYTAELAAKSEALNQFIESIGQTADSVGGISEKIDVSAEFTNMSASKLVKAVASLKESNVSQSSALSDAEEAFRHLNVSLQKVRSDVETQDAEISEAASSVALVAKETEALVHNVRQTRDFTSGLETTTSGGASAMHQLEEAIHKIKETSNTISSVVDAVEDFAERTNLLAMNAAIEAAHAGNSGKGFAVIAVEIKNLAAASAERAAMIRSSVADIVNRIGNGIEASGKVRLALDKVSQGAEAAADGITDISQSLESQQRATDDLNRILKDISNASAAIRREAEQQEQDGSRIQQRMLELVAGAEAMRQATEHINKENSSIAQSVQHLAEVSKEGKHAATGLRKLIESGSTE